VGELSATVRQGEAARSASANKPGCYTQEVLSGVKRFILWDYQRGVWQYDVMCAAITIFIFFAPRQWFRDQPAYPRQPDNVVAQPWRIGFLVESNLLPRFLRNSGSNSWAKC